MPEEFGCPREIMEDSVRKPLFSRDFDSSQPVCLAQEIDIAFLYERCQLNGGCIIALVLDAFRDAGDNKDMPA